MPASVFFEEDPEEALVVLPSDPLPEDTARLARPEDVFPAPLKALAKTSVIYGTTGNDFLKGTSGRDLIYGNSGSDRINFYPNTDPSVPDTFDGGGGKDLGVLYLTESLWFSAAFQAELAAWNAFAAASAGKTNFGTFTFTSLGLTLTSIEGLQILVDGTPMTLADEAANAKNEAYTVGVSGPDLAGNVLANDDVPDLVASISVTTQPRFGTVTLDADGNFVYEVNTDLAKVAALLPGETLTDSFSYTIVDADGDIDTAKVTITITGPDPQFGFLVPFLEAGDAVGVSVSSAGDINGDGIEDFMVSSPTADGQGKIYVIFGVDYASGESFASSFDLASLDGTNGFTILADPEVTQPGHSITTIGDVNGDGIDDILIGAPAHRQYGEGYPGSAYVVFGVDTAVYGDFTATLELADLDGTNGFVLEGISPDDNFGYKVASAGDVNGDGIDDILVGAYAVDEGRQDEVGCAYVIFGQDTSVTGDFDAVINVAELDGTNGFAIPGLAVESQTGHSVTSADVNGDGISDIIVGAYGTDVRGATTAGEVYVIFGQDTSVTGTFDATFDVSTLDGSNGFVIRSTEDGASVGRNVASIGDINGDGVDDLAVAGYGYDMTTDMDGTVYIVFGKDTATSGDFAATINVASLNGTNGFVIEAASSFDLTGRSIVGTGDVNGDGIDDFMVSAPNAESNGIDRTGQTYLIFGVDTAIAGDFDAVFDPNTLDGTNGYRFEGRLVHEYLGYSISASDVNGDGVKDLLIASYGEEEDTGLAVQLDTYVVFGGVENLEALDAKDGAVDGTIDLSYLTPDAFVF